MQNAVPTLFNPSVAAAAGAVDVKPKKPPTPKAKSVGDQIQSQIKHQLQHVPKFSPIEAKIPVEVFLSIIEYETIQLGLQKDCQLISLALEHLDISSMEKTFETKDFGHGGGRQTHTILWGNIILFHFIMLA